MTKPLAKNWEDSTQGINQKYSEWNPTDSRKSIKLLETELYKTRKAMAETNKLLREQREIETYTHQVASGQYNDTAQNIALRIKNEKDYLGWIIDDIVEDTPCPLSNTEFFELLSLYRKLPEEYCSDLRSSLLAEIAYPTQHIR